MQPWPESIAPPQSMVSLFAMSSHVPTHPPRAGPAPSSIVAPVNEPIESIGVVPDKPSREADVESVIVHESSAMQTVADCPRPPQYPDLIAV